MKNGLIEGVGDSVRKLKTDKVGTIYEQGSNSIERLSRSQSVVFH